MRDLEDLRKTLERIDGKGYKAYRDILGSYAFEGGRIIVDHVQADPFAAPSKVRVRLDATPAGLDSDCPGNRVRRIALEDFLAREAAEAFALVEDRGGRGAPLRIDCGGQPILERTAVALAPDRIEFRVEVALPAAGRCILGRKAAALLGESLPTAIGDAAEATEERRRRVRRHLDLAENHRHIQDRLAERGLVAFVGDGAILPRASGASDRPLGSSPAVPFESPESLRVSFELPHPVDGAEGVREIAGMGVPRGVTLVVGGGYHGKSTLLRAIERGIHPHLPGDGRDYVVTDPDAVKIRSEDRRRVEAVAITPFIAHLPNGADTDRFRTDEASGSTSQAAAIVEALETGASTLLMDEDTCATNLMVRDARMQRLVADADEPITPLVDRIRQLYNEAGVASILVMGGSGDYFDAADTVIRMDRYVPSDVTAEARRVADELPSLRRAPDSLPPLGSPPPRLPDPSSIDPAKGRKQKIDARDTDHLRFGLDEIDLRGLDQLVDSSQTRALGHALRLLGERYLRDGASLAEALSALERDLEAEGPVLLSPFPGRSIPDGTPHPGRLARPRRHEIAAALNRLRSLRVEGGATRAV